MSSERPPTVTGRTAKKASVPGKSRRLPIRCRQHRGTVGGRLGSWRAGASPCAPDGPTGGSPRPARAILWSCTPSTPPARWPRRTAAAFLPGTLDPRRSLQPPMADLNPLSTTSRSHWRSRAGSSSTRSPTGLAAGSGPALSHLMDRYRYGWMRVMTQRDMRMVDTIIQSAVLHGCTFFASTAILLVGGLLALLGATDRSRSSATCRSRWRRRGRSGKSRCSRS